MRPDAIKVLVIFLLGSKFSLLISILRFVQTEEKAVSDGAEYREEEVHLQCTRFNKHGELLHVTFPDH